MLKIIIDIILVQIIRVLMIFVQTKKKDVVLWFLAIIYLKFNIPENQEQKNFYLEAYDISDGETIITDGDCYFINTTENIDY
jgi:hypothetical protein